MGHSLVTKYGKYFGFSDGTVVNNLPANARNARDGDSILGLERSPGEGNDNPLQYSYLENSMDRGAWWATGLGITRELDTTEHPYIQRILIPNLWNLS